MENAEERNVTVPLQPELYIALRDRAKSNGRMVGREAAQIIKREIDGYDTRVEVAK